MTQQWLRATPVVSAPIAQLQTAAEVEPPVERPWLRLSLGGGAMQRVGYVPKPTSDGSNPNDLCSMLCGPLGEINPMFANVAGVVEVFPFRVGGGDGLAHLRPSSGYLGWFGDDRPRKWREL